MCKKSLATIPPPVDQIKWYKPDLVMLKMMSALNSSAAGVSDMLSQCLKQTGEDPDECAKGIQVFKGEMGTCLNFESVIRQRYPAEVAAESPNNVLNMPGLAHTMWNVATSVLGMPTDKLPSHQDPNLLLQMIPKAIQPQCQIFWSHKDPVECNEPGVAHAIDECYEAYFTVKPIENASKNGEWTLYNLRLQLRVFATIVEGYHAMQVGDIGCVLLMWKRWAVMAHGVKGLSQRPFTLRNTTSKIYLDP
ncbi:hypothetical protein DFH28DRAFT_1123196 [Melampsora americana]|nr:hypothetical protein DFH28DRAFT_1123196 [Melampsora americana]